MLIRYFLIIITAQSVAQLNPFCENLSNQKKIAKKPEENYKFVSFILIKTALYNYEFTALSQYL